MGKIKGLDAKVIEARSRELFERLNLQPSPLVSSGSLSKGNRQKLAIAQAFLGPVEILVLDEPYTGLDAPTRARLRSLVEQAANAGVTVLIATHHRDDWPAAVTRELELSHGRVLYDGPVR